MNNELLEALTLLENHAIIQRVEGKFNQGSCKFVILPTILTAVSGEKLTDSSASDNMRRT